MEPGQVVQETVTVEEDPHEVPPVISVETSEDGTTRRTETTVKKVVKTTMTRTVIPSVSDNLSLDGGGSMTGVGGYTTPMERVYRQPGPPMDYPTNTVPRNYHYGPPGGYEDYRQGSPSIGETYASLSRGARMDDRYRPADVYRTLDSGYRAISRNQLDPYAAQPQVGRMGSALELSGMQRFVPEPYGLEDDQRSVGYDEADYGMGPAIHYGTVPRNQQAFNHGPPRRTGSYEGTLDGDMSGAGDMYYWGGAPLAQMERYQSEKLLRRESQERYLELDDQIEQERRTMIGREKERERRENELEKKAREQADQLVALEEQRAGLGRELNTLKHTHNKLVLSYKDLLERKRDLEREGSPLSNHVRSKNSQSTQGQSESCVSGQELTDRTPETPPDSVLLEEPVTKDDRVIDIVMPDRDASFINDIISSTPELVKFHGLMKASTPVRADAKEPIGDETKTSMEEEMKEEEEKEEGGAKQENEGEEEDMGSLEWELRNTESVFSELSELSREYIESVDQGASVRGSTDQFEEILSQYEELKHTHELVNAARKALISRVEELTNERSALKVEVTSCLETVTRLEGRMKEMEEETKRLRKELEANKSDDSSLPISLRRFSRSEMSRVVMEKNQYKERLFELQEAVRRSQAIRATQEERITERERTSVWRRFNRLFGLNKNPLVPSAALALVLPTSPSLTHSPMGSPRQLAVSTTQTDGASPAAALSPRVRRRELYREIRSHVWGTLGKRQVHGWSMPLSHTQDSSEPTPEPKDVPVLVQLRLLDQRDSTAKLNCAVAVTPEISGETTCAVWVVSGPASSSDVTVINPARSNTVLDQFSLPPTSPALCICAVPPTGETSGTVWIGTQEGSVLVHSASTARRRCLQSISLSEGVHSLTYSHGQVIAGLANGTLAFFSHNPGGWDLQSHEVLPLGSTPLQPICCCLAKGAGLWVGYWNRVHVVDVENRKVEQTLTVSERSEQQVRFLCAAGSGVWTSCRLDPTLRLFDWSTGRPLQDVDLTPLVTKTLGPAFLSLSPLQISSLTFISGRLWVGTGSGAIFSIPVSLSSESASIPYCSLAAAQLCYHGHRQAVKFIIAAPGCVTSSSTIGGGAVTLVSTSQLILSGGEGYINFRIGDNTNDGAPEAAPLRSDRSHMIIWQTPTPSLPSSAL